MSQPEIIRVKTLTSIGTPIGVLTTGNIVTLAPVGAEAEDLASVLRGMTSCSVAPDDLWTRDQPDGDPFVARAAELLELQAAEIERLKAGLAGANAEFADVWHQGSGSFYRALLMRKLTPAEAFSEPPEIAQ